MEQPLQRAAGAEAAAASGHQLCTQVRCYIVLGSANIVLDSAR